MKFKAHHMIEALAARMRQSDFFGLDALSIGGSVGRGEHDQWSDIDVFLLISEEDIHSYARSEIRDLLVTVAPKSMVRGPVFVNGFGYSCTIVFDDLSVCQMNFNSSTSIQPTVEWATSHEILVDRSSRLTMRIRNMELSEATTQTEGLTEYYRYFWIRALFAQRSLTRGELWRTIRYLTDMRDVMARLLRVEEVDSSPPLLRSPLSRLEAEIGAKVNDLAFTAPQYNHIDIENCLRQSVLWFDRQYERVGAPPVDDSVALIVTKIRAQITWS